MFQNIPKPILNRMRLLEEIDRQDRIDGTPHIQRLRQIPPETGKFIALLAATAPPGQYVEIGTSAGYSTLWLALACRLTQRRITTFEILDAKAELARDTFRLTGVSDVVDFVCGDVRDHLSGYKDIAFCFIDGLSEVYSECYETVVPNLVPGGILVADNAVSHEHELRSMLENALNDPRVDALIVPICKGELVCRKI
ncbi:MAG: O-methyltransferase [Candidatus Hatepunaea meridiana]|nr:O-methyltransferase [Candidatus Hatepunaea meridiana]